MEGSDKCTDRTQEMQMKRIASYQAFWSPLENKGYFWFTYFDGERERTVDLDAGSFKIILEILHTDKPIFGDHTTATVAVHSEPTEMMIGAWA
ncbi:MAG: hypothetical protein LDL41_24645 [Coleofasciculus sp. S288]|nr:hypothetical protein [Coleofasciculus sp. S288]